MKVLGAAVLIFLSLFAVTHQSVIGGEVIPCDGSLVVYCWTADILGTGLSWLVWHAGVSLFLGFALVTLSRSVSAGSTSESR